MANELKGNETKIRIARRLVRILQREEVQQPFIVFSVIELKIVNFYNMCSREVVRFKT